jgi:hypothetical protein
MNANPFGANANSQFTCQGQVANSASNNLTILGQPGHSCVLNSFGLASFGIGCRNPGGGICSGSCSR